MGAEDETTTTARFFAWTPSDDPGEVYDVREDGAWDALRTRYDPGGTSRPLDRIIEVAKASGVVSVVLEYRYIDIDFRSEHSDFYSTTFQRYPSVCHRLHFFTAPVNEDLSGLSTLHDAYRGYSVMRPLPGAPVGRTMLAPPPADDVYWALVRDRVHLFGEPFDVEAVPFTSQDAQYLRCAHAAQWMVLYHAHLHRGAPRRLPSEIHDASMGGVVTGRQIPSEGLSVQQMMVGLGRLGLSPGMFKLPESREVSKSGDGPSLFDRLCRHVNSQLPPIVVSKSHAWVIAGYAYESGADEHDQVRLFRNDDAVGPYIPVIDPWNEPEEPHQEWSLAITPLPSKVYVPAARVEALGVQLLEGAAGESPTVASLLEDGRLAYRTYVVRANEFKSGLLDRGVDPVLAEQYRQTHLPRFIWVVEAFDRDRHASGQPSVVGEVIVDATAHHLMTLADETVLAVRVGERGVVRSPDYGEQYIVEINFQACRSGCPVVP